MALRFIAIDPETDTDHCPAVFIEEETGDFLFQSWTVTDAAMLADAGRHSPLAGNESVVRLPARMRAIILEALSEQVRWLPRRRASDLCLPGNDFWLFDDQLIRFHHFSGDGEIVEDELVSDPRVIQMCAAAFEAVWARAIPHSDYRLS